jgi:hypothetical protein
MKNVSFALVFVSLSLALVPSLTAQCVGTDGTSQPVQCDPGCHGSSAESQTITTADSQGNHNYQYVQNTLTCTPTVQGNTCTNPTYVTLIQGTTNCGVCPDPNCANPNCANWNGTISGGCGCSSGLRTVPAVQWGFLAHTPLFRKESRVN